MTLNYVTLTLDLYDGLGNYPVSGTATFTPSAVLTDAGAEIIGQQPIVVTFHAAALPTVSLLATDNSGPLPTGWTWGVTFSGITGAPAPFSFALPYASGATQVLSDQIPVSTGTTFAASMPALTQTAVKTAAYSMAANQLVPVSTASAAVTITLPDAPPAGTIAGVKMVTQGSTNTVTIDAAGSDVFNKSGGGTSLTLTLLNQGALLQYDSGIWMVLSDDLPLSQLDLRYAEIGSDGHLSSSFTPRPSLYAATGLRRWRAAAGDALFSQVPIVCVGDSITAGQGGDNDATVFSNIPDNSNGWAGQLRALYAAALGSVPGEGFIFADDSRVTWAGGTANSNWACVPLRHGPRLLHGSGNTLALTIPNGVTSLGVIQANETQSFNSGGSDLADVSALYSQTGSQTVTNTSITTLTNTGLPLTTGISCQPGDVITVSAPGSAQSYIVGFTLTNANPGVLVHRVGQPGYVSGDMLGGQTSGTLIQSASSANQVTAERACYYWAGTTGLIIVGFGTNDQANQGGAGSSNQNDVTLSLYTTWMEQFVNQAISDGWCCLIVGQPRNPNAYSGGSTEDQYFAAMKAFALATDHVAYIDVGELWGSSTASSALNLTQSNSVHPLRRGHGDIARMLYTALALPGIAELAAA